MSYQCNIIIGAFGVHSYILFAFIWNSILFISKGNSRWIRDYKFKKREEEEEVLLLSVAPEPEASQDYSKEFERREAPPKLILPAQNSPNKPDKGTAKKENYRPVIPGEHR